MKKNFNFLLSGIAAVTFLFSSCSSLTNMSVQKRQHRGGYYVDWGNGKVKTDPANRTSASANHARASQLKKDAVPAVSEPAMKRETAATLEQKNPSVKPASARKNAATEPYTRNSFKVKEEPVAQSANASKKVISSYSYSFSNAYKDGSSGSTPQWLLAVLCIFIPPLAVFLSEGIGQPFWIDLILALVGLGALATGFLGLFWLAAIVYAFVVIF